MPRDRNGQGADVEGALVLAGLLIVAGQVPAGVRARDEFVVGGRAVAPAPGFAAAAYETQVHRSGLQLYVEAEAIMGGACCAGEGAQPPPLNSCGVGCTAAPARNVTGRKRLSRRAPLHLRKSRDANVLLAAPRDTTTQDAATPAHGKAVINMVTQLLSCMGEVLAEGAQLPHLLEIPGE